MEQDEKVRLGEEAKALLANPLLRKYFSIEATRMFATFTSEKLTQEQAVELQQDAVALNRLKAKLEQFIKSGEIEERKQNGETSIADGIGPII